MVLGKLWILRRFNMDIDRINSELTKRFKAPLPEFYRRHIIFWYDEEREFEDRLEELNIPDVKILKLDGHNMFMAKKTLAIDDEDSNYLVYVPISFNEAKDNWLLNIELYSGEIFRSDIAAIWMQEMRIPDTQDFYSLVRFYKSFFANQKRRAKFTVFSSNISNKSQFHLTVMAVICGSNKTPSDIIKTILANGLDKESNQLYKDIVSYRASEPFWQMIRQTTGFQGDDFEDLLCTIFLSADSRNVDCLFGLGRYINDGKQYFCYDLTSDWQRTDDSFKEYSTIVERKLKLRQRFESSSLESIVDCEFFPSADPIIISKLFDDISNNVIDTQFIRHTVDRRKTSRWFSRWNDWYYALLEIANIHEYQINHMQAFHELSAETIWKKYAAEDYLMDTYYRHFNLHYMNCLKEADSYLDDKIKAAADIVESVYSNWFLQNLSSNWFNTAKDSLKSIGSISGVSKQNFFYSSRIKNATSRVFVIISDALRYEVAAELASELRKTQADVSLETMFGVFPSETKFGMPALLPNTKLTIDPGKDEASVLCDGNTSDNKFARDKILKSAKANSVALNADSDIFAIQKDKRTALIRGMDVVYIYHDKIDNTSHSNEKDSFKACQEAIEEIKSLIRIIVNEFNGTHIFITSDHGFLCTLKPLSEDSRLSKSSWKNNDIDHGRRHVIMKKGCVPDFMIPVKMFDDNYDGYSPSESIRISTQGQGGQFVHGGASIQELMIPLIDYRYLRNGYKSYINNKEKYDVKPVTIDLINSSRSTSNKSFYLNFFQKEAVDDRHEAVVYQTWFEDASGIEISNRVEIIADKTNENKQERTIRKQFNLKDLKFDNHETYYLIIKDKDGLQIPQKIPFTIDIAFALDDFDFFS